MSAGIVTQPMEEYTWKGRKKRYAQTVSQRWEA